MAVATLDQWRSVERETTRNLAQKRPLLAFHQHVSSYRCKPRCFHTVIFEALYHRQDATISTLHPYHEGTRTGVSKFQIILLAILVQ